MKKTYMNPSLKVVKVQPAQFIAASLTIKNEDAKQSLGREARFSDWDEEE